MNKLRFTRNALRIFTIILMFAIVAVATADGFAQSYSALLDWAEAHKLSGWKKDSFPLLVDAFILIGELGLFLIALDGFRLRKSVLAWTDVLMPLSVVTAGWTVSVWFNIHHVDNATREDRVTFAIPPIAAMIGLFIMLRTVHRYMSALEDIPEPATVTATAEIVEDIPEPLSPTGYTIPSLDDQTSMAALASEPVKNGDLVEYAPESAGELPAVRPVSLDKPEPVTPESAPEPQDEPVPATVPEWQPSGIIADEPVKPAAVETSPNGRTPHGAGQDHPKWDEGVKIYRESLQGPGKAMSQRDLAAALEMKNRTLAANIIKHVKGEK